MGTAEIVGGIQLRVKLSDSLWEMHPECDWCHEELYPGTVVFMDTKTKALLHLKECRRDAVREYAIRNRLTPVQIVTIFRIDRPQAYRIYGEVTINGHGRER